MMDNLILHCKKCKAREAARNAPAPAPKKRKKKVVDDKKQVESDGIERDHRDSAID